ncbi:MAG: hypothetical protein ACO1TE_29440, partial [Prosthecobacter sp.]
GSFNSLTVLATTRYSIARLTSTGSVESGFNSPLTASITSINTVNVDAADNVYVGGFFSNFAGTTGANYLVRLNASNGALDTGFTVGTLGTVDVVRPLADGKVLVGCQTARLVRLTSTGANDPTFSYTGGLSVTDILPVPNSTDYIICGPSGVQRITADGALVTPWPASGTTASGVTDLATTGGRLFVGGSFTSYNSLTHNRIAMLGTDGTMSSGFNSGSGFNSTVNSLRTDSAGRVWVAGGFTTYRGVTADKLVVIYGEDSIPGDPGLPTSGLEAYLTNAGVPAGQRGPNDDPDLDGLSNLLEYALDLPPNISSRAGLPTTATTPPTFSLTYRRARAAITYVVEASPDLSPGSWSAVGVDQGTPQVDGTTTASVPLASGRQFLRLSVSQ